MLLLLLLPHMLANISAMAVGGEVHSEEENIPTDLVQAHSDRLFWGSLCWIEVKKFG